jgi:hypothetical protein
MGTASVTYSPPTTSAPSVHTSTGFMRAVNNPIVDDDGSPAFTFKRRVRAHFLRREAPLFAALALVRYSIFGHYGYSNPYILAVCRRTVPKSSSRSDEFWRASQHRTPWLGGICSSFQQLFDRQSGRSFATSDRSEGHEQGAERRRQTHSTLLKGGDKLTPRRRAHKFPRHSGRPCLPIQSSGQMPLALLAP